MNTETEDINKRVNKIISVFRILQPEEVEHLNDETTYANFPEGTFANANKSTHRSSRVGNSP